MRAPLWSILISSRPRNVPIVHAVAFTVVFNALIIIIFLLLVALYPLRLVRRASHQRIGKALFGKLLVLVSRVFFGDLEFVVSTDPSRNDANDSSQPGWVERDDNGRVVRIRVPQRSVWISNHQTLADWLFLWQFFYLTDSSPSLYIALKSSLRSIPVIGTACKWFGFAFLERNWTKDKVSFDRQLNQMAVDCTTTTTRDDEQGGGKLDFLLFPEGTIVTANTRGISSKFADKTGLQDFENCLLPRSTGLFFALRQLAIRVPHLQLTDLTVGYPLPRSRRPCRRVPNSTETETEKDEPWYPSEFYSLPSVFLERVPPPVLHFHLRYFSLDNIPLGDLESLKERRQRPGGAQVVVDEGTERERQVFDKWLLERWKEKDDLLKRFNETGSFVNDNDRRRRRRGAENETANQDEDEDEDDEKVKGEIGWKPRLRNPVLETLQVVAFGFPCLVAARWGLQAISSAGQALFGIGLDAIAGRSTRAGARGGAMEQVVTSCGCGKMGQGGGGGGIERIDL